MRILPQDSPTLFDGKVCTVCGRWKLFAGYYKRNDRPSGYLSQCIECDHAYKRSRAVEILERNRRYRAAHPEMYKQADRKRNRNPERLAQQRVHGRDHYQRHKEDALTRVHARYARIKSVEGRHTTAEWIDLCRQYDGYCLRCWRQVKLSRDHVIPLSKGGPNSIGNLQPLCKPCNSSKSDKHRDYRPIATVALAHMRLMQLYPFRSP